MDGTNNLNEPSIIFLIRISTTVTFLKYVLHWHQSTNELYHFAYSFFYHFAYSFFNFLHGFQRTITSIKDFILNSSNSFDAFKPNLESASFILF